MPKVESRRRQGPPWHGPAVGLAALVPPTTAIALAHMLATAHRGIICGATAGPGHCWACYAAPMLALAAMAAWALATEQRPVRVGAR